MDGAAHQTSSHAVAYVRAGLALVPIPSGQKSPIATGWNQSDQCVRTEDQVWRLRGMNIGLAHAYCQPSPTGAIDIDDFDRAAVWCAERGFDLVAALSAPDAVQIRSGQPNRAKLLYRLPAAMREFAHIDGGNAVIDFRCASRTGKTVQDVLPPSIHPITRQPYQWHLGEAASLERIPDIPTALLRIWRENEPPEQVEQAPPSPATSGAVNLDLSRLPQDLRILVVEGAPVGERSTQFFHAVGWLRDRGHTVEQIEALLQAYPAGIAAKFADRLPQEVRRAFDKTKERERDESPPTAAPIDIFREMATPVLAPEMFPPCLSEYATVHAGAAGHDTAAYLVAMLSAAASAIGDDIHVELDRRTQWKEHARLWMLLLGAPGSAKTPAIRVAVAPIQAIHKDMAVEHARAVAASGKDEPSPARRAMLISDATVEALSDVLLDNPRGVLAIYEELDSWIGSHDCYRNGQGSKDRGDWLRTYDGGPHQINRVKRGAIYLPNWSVSIIGATTPAGLRRHARDLPADGLIQRFLSVIVRPMCAADESIDQKTIDDARRRYEQRLFELFNARGGVVRLSSDAAEVFTTRRAALRGEVSAMASFSEPFAGHMAKHPAMLGRLALVFHCLEHGAAAVDIELAGDTMARAAFVLKQLTRHSLALFSMLAGDSGPSALARACGSSIVAAGAETVTRRDLIGKCRAFKDATEHARESALRFLVDAAWITPINDERQYAGRPARFRVHPDVHAQFAEQGEALRARRSALHEVFE